MKLLKLDIHLIIVLLANKNSELRECFLSSLLNSFEYDKSD